MPLDHLASGDKRAYVAGYVGLLESVSPRKEFKPQSGTLISVTAARRYLYTALL